jgi:hypothetical protein
VSAGARYYPERRFYDALQDKPPPQLKKALSAVSDWVLLHVTRSFLTSCEQLKAQFSALQNPADCDKPFASDIHGSNVPNKFHLVKNKSHPTVFFIALTFRCSAFLVCCIGPSRS